MFHVTKVRPISEVNSLGIQAVAKCDGFTEALFVGDNGEQGDARVEIWDLGGMLVANTNGDPVWQESMPEKFEGLVGTIQFAP